MATEGFPVWIGWDPHDMCAHVVSATSLRQRTTHPVSVRRIARSILHEDTRPTEWRDGRLWDVISDAPMSTEHAIARFFVPYLQDFAGWALFVDGDVLFRSDVRALLDAADPRYAVQVVQHPPLEGAGVKKAGALQLPYQRKNWSSVMLINCGHPANRALTLEVLNTWPGRDLHAFRWLEDDQIGALEPGWNYLVGVTDPAPDPVHLAHFTLGTPDLPGHEDDPFADEWVMVAAAAGYRLPRRRPS